MNSKVLHQSHSMPTDGVGEKPSFSPEQIEEYNITPEELASAGQNVEPQEEPQDKILGKFESQEDLEKAYKELEKKYHAAPRNKSEAPSAPPTENTVEEGVADDGEETSEEASDTEPNSNREAVGQAFAAFQEAGELTDEVVGEFEKAGIPKELVERVKELEDFKTQAENKSIQDDVGGEESYGAMLDWAGENLSEKEITVFDNIIDNGTPDEVRFAVNNLNGRMNNATTPKQSKLIKADAIATATGGYPSQAHMLADMNDPRYQSDPAFRDKVMSKSNSSKW